MRCLPAAVIFFTTTALLAQTQPQPTPSQEVPPHDITKVDAAPLGGAISVPVPEAERKRLSKYDIPELVGARQALGPQLIDGRLPKPIVDYISKEGVVEQRLSMFEGGLVVIDVTGVGATIMKKLIIPDDAMKAYLKVINAKALADVPEFRLIVPRTDRFAKLRVYADGKFVERTYDPIVVLPKTMSDQILPLQDLLRAMSEDRGITNSIAGYVPAVGDQLVADDQKVYRVERIIENRMVELRCVNQPTTIYVAIKDLYNYFIGTTGAARQ